ncbi:hypothetical protein WICPIJ_000762, partial [Wickerhamomyces pijperi]
KDQDNYTKLFEQKVPFEINTDPASESSILDPTEVPYDRTLPDKETARYWLIRFQPLFANRHRKMAVAICNRSGVETELMYAGSSSIYQFNGELYEDGVDLDVLGSLGQGVEGVLVRDVEL